MLLKNATQMPATSWRLTQLAGRVEGAAVVQPEARVREEHLAVGYRAGGLVVVEYLNIALGGAVDVEKLQAEAACLSGSCVVDG